MAYNEGGGTVFKVLDEAGEMVCTVAVLGSEKNGYNASIISPSGQFVGHRLQDLDQAIPNTAHFPLPVEVREAISCGLHDIKNGFPIGLTAHERNLNTEEQDIQSFNEQASQNYPEPE